MMGSFGHQTVMELQPGGMNAAAFGTLTYAILFVSHKCLMKFQDPSYSSLSLGRAISVLFRRKTIWTAKHDFQKMRAQFIDIMQTLNAADIPYHLEGGTLLGIVRDGDLLEHDKDTDISINAEDLEHYTQARDLIRARGWRVRERVVWYDLPFAAKGAPRILKVADHKFGLARGPHQMDIFVKYPSAGGQRSWVANKALMSCSAHHYAGFEPLEWNGMTLRAPVDYKAYLTAKYGDWSVVDKNWTCAQEKTIYADISEFDPSLPPRIRTSTKGS